MERKDFGLVYALGYDKIEYYDPFTNQWYFLIEHNLNIMTGQLVDGQLVEGQLVERTTRRKV